MIEEVLKSKCTHFCSPIPWLVGLWLKAEVPELVGLARRIPHALLRSPGPDWLGAQQVPVKEAGRLQRGEGAWLAYKPCTPGGKL